MTLSENAFLPVDGIRLGVAAAGIRYQGRDDLVLIELAEKSKVAGVFTKNAFCAAPVTIAKQNLSASPRWLLINSGNANAGTGTDGMRAAEETCAMVAKAHGCLAEQVLPFSTGVIGELLPSEKFTDGIHKASSSLSADGWLVAAKAIMTTDTRPKLLSKTVSLPDGDVTVTGMAKGSGMIHPNMATMLSFIATDAPFAEEVLLQQVLSDAVDSSFNCITVDGDTSTNDACMLIATGTASIAAITRESDAYPSVVNAIKEVCQYLAEAIVRDGEGATKLVRVAVENAKSEAEAHQVANTIALSPLVKTALFASDPNWGRILAAVGRAGVTEPELDVSQTDIYLGDVQIVSEGQRDAAYTEAEGQRVMSCDEIIIRVNLKRGAASKTVLTCDFSYDYVRINAEYRS